MAELENIIESEDNAAQTETAADTDEGAGARAPEDARNAADPWEKIAGTQQQTIESLTAHIESLNAQIARLVQGGAQVSDGKQMPANAMNMHSQQGVMPASAKSDDYIPLADLGKEIGKPNKKAKE